MPTTKDNKTVFDASPKEPGRLFDPVQANMKVDEASKQLTTLRRGTTITTSMTVLLCVIIIDYHPSIR